jgi:hypothetical protein
MEPKGCDSKKQRRSRRLLTVAGLIALTVGLWPSTAQAAVSCRIHDYLSCGRFVCCLVTCIFCTDSETGDSSVDCSDVACYDRFL